MARMQIPSPFAHVALTLPDRGVTPLPWKATPRARKKEGAFATFLPSIHRNKAGENSRPKGF
jgi:hypothetical protein